MLRGWEAFTPSSTRNFDWDAEADEAATAAELPRTLPPAAAREKYRFAMGSRGLQRRVQKVERAAKIARESHNNIRAGGNAAQASNGADIQTCDSWMFDSDEHLKRSDQAKVVGDDAASQNGNKTDAFSADALFSLPVVNFVEDRVAIKEQIRKFKETRKAALRARKKLSLTPRGYEFDVDAPPVLRPPRSDPASSLVSRTLNLLKTQLSSPRDFGTKAKEAAMDAARAHGVVTSSYSVDDLSESAIAEAYLPSRSKMNSRIMQRSFSDD